MDDYKKMYYELFNKITDVIELLKKARQDAEERFISADDFLWYPLPEEE